ncbi:MULTISPECIES: hypothetical protein [unclassified Streptomyces]|uniref:hypothetical protein n=1 Tax=unclassified Streptomyces TaxID=2593676 RepID=UPI00081DCA40|nr:MULTISPECIES: hypothetical protein [unclassified Streptomyces]MYR95471.1 hypothetical protein [Streptomyces sp. SID4937]SCD90967.1 hypothetical protein GA0115243_104756 [Streptomyces sp. ScaeMP-e83]
MKNFKVRWVEDGRERVSVVAYNESSAKRRAEELELQDGVSDVRVVSVAPGV